MLKIINDLREFFEDCYRRISVREYSRIMKISPPTASKLLDDYFNEGLLKKEKDRGFIFYYANRESSIFIDLSRIYWKIKLRYFINEIEEKFIFPTIILFGSLSKAEVKKDSDIDILIIGKKLNINADKFEKKLKRNIQIFNYSSFNEIKNKELKNNILNGYILSGRLNL